MDLTNKVALVTGSTQGIGLATAHELGKHGCNLIVTGLCPLDEGIAIATQLAGKYNIQAIFLEGNLLNLEEIEKLVAAIHVHYPAGVDILVNNAGFNHVVHVVDFPDERWDAMVGIHLSAPFHLIKRLLPDMQRKKWGRIINISSQMGIISIPGKAVYSAVKAGLIGLTKGVALEAAPYGVTCNAVCPTYAESEMVDVQLEKRAKTEGITFDQALADLLLDVPTKKRVTFEQIAELVGFLIYSEASPQMTGAHYLIDGGLTAH